MHFFIHGLRGVAVLSAFLAVAPTPARTPAPSLATASTNPEIFFGRTEDAPYQIAVRAYVWGYPLVEAAKIREKATASGPGLNRLRHERKLADPSRRTGVGPNNDTIYSTAWLDLESGPFVLETPDFGGRYYTFQMGFADSSAEQSLGQRTNGAQMPPVFIHGPSFHGVVPTGMIGVSSPTRYLLVAGRILVKGPEDLATVHALQDRIRLRSWHAYQTGANDSEPSPTQRPQVAPAHSGSSELDFLGMLQHVLRDWVVTEQDRALVASFNTIGLNREEHVRPTSLSEKTRVAVARGIADGAAIVKRKSINLGVNRNGWTTNYVGPRFGRDYLLRAGVAKDQIFVTVPEEAIYPIGRVDAAGMPLNGRRSYRIRFAKNQLPPVQAFWSITMYDDQGAMVANPINRYSISDRTPGLVWGSDGSLDIRLQHRLPETTGANWLPAPDGPFYLMMRLYRPTEAARAGHWIPPAIEPL